METMVLLSMFASLFGGAFSLFQRNKELDQNEQLFRDSQDFQREREDLAYQRNLPSNIYQDMLSQGFNPNLAASAIMGQGAGSPASAGGSPAALPTQSAMSVLQDMFGRSSSQLFDSYLRSAQVENLQANTNKTDIESGIMPRDYWLRSLTVTKQLELWDKSVEKMTSEIGYSHEMTEYVKNQNLYYGRLSEAQIEAYQAQVFQACATAMNQLESIKTQQSQQDVNRAYVGLLEAEKSNVIQDTSNKIIEGSTEYYRSERERIAKEFEESLGGVPLTADAQKMVNLWAERGEYDKIREFYSCIFQSSLNQQLGTAFGTPNKTKIGLPFNLYDNEKYQFNRFHNFENMPYWNPPRP